MSECWVPVSVVAEHLSVSEMTVRRMVVEGLPRVRVRGQLRFRLSQVDAWLESEAGSGEGAEVVPLTRRAG